MKNITKNIFLLGSALTVCVHYTRGNDYNPDYREQVWSKIREAYLKQVSDFLEENYAPKDKRLPKLMCCKYVDKMMEIVKNYKEPNKETDISALKAKLMCCKCVDKMTEIVKNYKESNKETDISALKANFKKVLEKNKNYLSGKCCCFAHSLLILEWSPSAPIEALEMLDVCDRFKKQYGCEMHAMHARMLKPGLYVEEQVSLEVLRELIRGYERVNKKAAMWESCNYYRPSEDEFTKSDVLNEWNKSVCEFLKSQKNKSEEEVFDAFVGYNDNPPYVWCWGRPRLFSGDWWAETKPVKKNDYRVNTDNVNFCFKNKPAWQYYHPVSARCYPVKYCNDDFKLVAKKMVKRCKGPHRLLYNELKEKNLNPTLTWFLDEVLKQRVLGKRIK